MPNVDTVDSHEPIDDWNTECNEFFVTELVEHDMVESKLRDIAKTVWKQPRQLRLLRR